MKRKRKLRKWVIKTIWFVKWTSIWILMAALEILFIAYILLWY